MSNPLYLEAPPRPATQKSIRFQRWYDELRNLLDGRTPEDQKKAIAANQDFIRGIGNPRYTDPNAAGLKAVTPAAVHVDTVLSTFSVMYANSEFIGEQLMPVATVSKRSDKYVVYPKRERFAFPDDEIGHRASPNELEATRTYDNFSVRDYGYKNFLDLETLQNEDAPLNEMLDVVEAISEGIAFRREKRIMALVTASGNYGGNTAGATTEWDDTTDEGGTIITDILSARAGIWRGKTPTRLVAFCPLAVWNTCIANNPKVRDLFKYTESGLAVTTQVARYFRLDDILITESREDTANEGQTASYARMVTGDIFGILAVAQRPTIRSLHWGTTFRMRNDPFTTQWQDPGIGKRGGIWARISVSEDHKIVAPDAGFLITDVITD